MAKNHNVRRTRHMIHEGKRITPQNGVGRVLEHIYDPRGTKKTIKPMMIPMRTKNPKSPTIVKHQLQANQLPKSLNQKTDFATTPNKRLYVGSTICHFRSSNNKISTKY